MTEANRHPADALADIRSQIKTLRELEAALRAQLITGGDLAGDEHVAHVVTIHQLRIDIDEAVRKHFGAEAIKPFLTSSAVTQVRLKDR